MAKRGNPNIGKIGRHFSSTYQPENRGAHNPISDTVKKLREQGVSKPSYAEIQSIFLHLASLPLMKVKELEEDENQAMLTRVVAKEIRSGQKGFTALQYILDRTFGKPTQVTENYNENKESTRPIIVIEKPNGDCEENED